MIKSPINQLQFQEFYFSSYLAYKGEGFVGRKWFFLDLEKIFEENNETVGVLITGAPGSGKTALMSQLICSPYSSLLIHENIIGYHLCEYSEKGKRDGARFVRNLVDQIAARIPEYSKHVINNEQIRTELATSCHKDPTSCFFSTIVGPLRMLKQPNGHRFIIIDGLDECFENDLKTSEIMEIFNSKMPHFPKWLKVILTSRNLTTITSRLPQMQLNRMPLYSTDERNVDDIRYYVSRFISQNTDFSDRLLTAMNIGSKTDGLKIFLDEVITRAEGNFLFVKMTLQYMNDTGGKIDFHSLPKSLFDLYNSFFNRQFGEGGFGPFRPLFEVLLAVFSPLPSQDVQEILKMEYKMEDVPKHIEHISCFLLFGSDGIVRVYHQSFTDWLINKTTVLSINKTRGHQSIASFLLRRILERHTDVTFEELTKLFMHILSGQASEMQETAMDLLNITEMREAQTNQSILHYLVTKPVIYRHVLHFFLQKFKTVDVLDARNKTPAFYAASEGFVRNLQRFIDNGADISSFMEGYTEIDPVSVLVRNTGIEEFSLMHAAAAKGHVDVVELLIKSNISFPDSNKRYPTPLHLAAGNGHLEVFKLFHDHGATFDPIMLHHAAARNHSHVVAFLLHTVGIRDTCIQCEPEHFSQLSLNHTMQEAHTYFCETALHVAVSRGLGDIVEILLAYGKEALDCRHYSGKTVLMDAVERNDTEMVNLLLRHGANVTTECGRKISKDSNRKLCSIYSMDKQVFLYTVYCVNDSCECGGRATHISAKYGLWQMAEKMTSERILDLVYLRNCGNDSALRIAIHYDQARFVRNINTTFNKVGYFLVPSLMVELAVKYCSVNVANLFLNYPVNYKVNNVWDLLLRLVAWSPCKELKAEKVSSYCLKAFQDRNLSEEEKIKKESERRLRIIKLLIETHQREFSIVSYRKDNGLTLLHYAAFYGFEDAVKYLVELGADTILKDQNHNTPLMITVNKSPVNDLHPSASYRCYTTNDGQFSSCNTTCYDEIARYLIQSQRASISKCDHESSFMLKQVISKRMPLSLYALLTIGVDLSCRFNDFGSVMLLHLCTGGREVSEVLNMFEVDISLRCEVSFSKSELHRVSSFLTPDKFGNLFQPSVNKKRFPLQRLIDRHPRGVRILDECYDAEGYLPIHRAAEDGNLAVLKWFKSIGVNTQLKTRSGLTALDVSTLGLRNNYFMYLSILELRYRNECYEELLRTFFDTSYKNYSSDFSSSPFSKYPILHLASKTGLDVLKDVYKKALEIVPSFKKNTFLLLDEQDEDGNTPLHIAAERGLEDVVKYLVRLGADINIKNKDGNTPLLTALQVSSAYFGELYSNQRCYTTNDHIFTSCKTTSCDEIVMYLLWLKKSSILKCDSQSAYLLNNVILKRMPLSLYALLKIGVDVNCQENGNLSPLLQHIRVGSEEVSQVLQMFEVDVSVKCGVPYISSELHRISYVATSGDFGNFFRPSLNKKRSPLQRLIDRHPIGVRILDECYDAAGYLPIHRAAEGGNLAAIKWFKSIGVNTQLKTRSGFTALDVSTLRLRNNMNYFMHLSTLTPFLKVNLRHRNECFKELLGTFFDTSYKNYSSDFSTFSFAKYPILHLASKAGLEVFMDVYKKALEIVPSLKRNTFLIVDEQDENGNTPLHIAAINGREDVVKYLVRLGADVNVNNRFGFSPLLVALTYSPNFWEIDVDRHCYTTNDGLFTSCKTTTPDEIARYLLWSQKSSILKCDAKSALLLNRVISKGMPLSLYAILKIGVDVNCHEEKIFSPPLLEHIREGNKEVSEVLKIFEVNVSVRCGITFRYSELHLISFAATPDDFGSFFQPSLNKKRSPLQRLIDRHPRGVRILDECYDAEGFLPIHRAAQGGNLVAIKWFKSIGVNTQLKTRSGLTALDISILCLGDVSYGELISPLYGLYRQVPVTTSKYRNHVFEELLRTFVSTTPEYRSEFPCGSTLKGLSPLHIAAVKGITVLRYVHKKASEIFPSLPMNCVNKHRLDPVYLVHFYASVRIEGLIDKHFGVIPTNSYINCKETSVWYSLEDEMPAAQYPEREVDYTMVFNYLYHPPLDEITEEKILFESKGISGCPGYYDNLLIFEGTVFLKNPELPDDSECDKIRVRHFYYWSLCMLEVNAYRVLTENCPQLLKQLQSWFTSKQRRNRQLSPFILKRLGWRDDLKVSNINNRWPFYFLHKKLLKKYKAYEYLNVLNEAFEMSDIRFFS